MQIKKKVVYNSISRSVDLPARHVLMKKLILAIITVAICSSTVYASSQNLDSHNTQTVTPIVDTTPLMLRNTNSTVNELLIYKPKAAIEVANVVTAVESVTPTVTWQDNPNNCNQDTQFIAADAPFACIDKPMAAPQAVQQSYVTQAPVSSGTGNCEAYRGLISQYSWNVSVAMEVCRVESGGNPNAANWNDHHATCNGSFGLFQINCGNGQLYDPAANVAQAYRMWLASGWQPWSFTTCKIVSCY